VVGELFVERLRRVVERYGNCPAVEGLGEALNYDQLWALSGRVANGLRREGIGVESIVGVALPKSPALIATIIGCWRARAAFLPLSPELPPERLAVMVQEASPKVVIDTVDQWESIVAFGAEESTEESTDLVGERSDLAWIVFTSGSTGRPRGVAMEQRGYVPVVDAQRAAFRIEQTSRVLQFYSTSFDASLSDIGTALLSGATLCLEDRQSLAECQSLIDLLRDREVTHADIPPSLLALHLPSEAPPSLQTVIIGGEVCSLDVVKAWADRVRLINVYGPTEATICTSLSQCDAEGWTRPLLGQPLPGVEYLVANERGQAVARGEAGELWIGGDCLAREYTNQPAETATRFPTIGGRRMYRSGDRVLESDGEFVFLGRMDRQVQVRGMRVELEEIESTIVTVGEVSRSAVVYRKLNPDSDHQNLIAFVEPRSGVDEGEIRDEIRCRLHERLPSAVCPARIEILSQLPITSSGKTDLGRLHDWPLRRTGFQRFQPVRQAGSLSYATLALTEIFRSVLHNNAIGIDDDFFEHGGDSLLVLALSVVAQRRQIVLPGPVVIEHRTPRRIAQALTSAANMSEHSNFTLDVPIDSLTSEWLRADVQAMLAEHEDDGVDTTTDGPTTDGPTTDGTAAIGGNHSGATMLLTGTTGFLGSRLLVEWVSRSETTSFICLIRADDDEHALRRLRASLQRYCLAPREQDWARIRCVAGDVSRGRFGWPLSSWSDLARRVDGVVHCAARVNVLDSYQELRADNVVGTANVLHFTASGRPKRLHFVSTLSVFVGSDHNTGRLLESDDLTRDTRLHGGYAQSKWAAEVLVRSYGLPGDLVDIYRLGLLTGDTQDGVIPAGDLLTMTVRGLASLGCVPSGDPDLQVDITPLDFAVEAIVTLGALEPATSVIANETSPRCWHIANPVPLPARRLFDAIVAAGQNIERVDAYEFLRRAEQMAGAEDAVACLCLCRWLASNAPSELPTSEGKPSMTHYSTMRPLDLFQVTHAQFDQRDTLPPLQSRAVECPRPDRALIDRYVAQILRSADSPL
jgi:amino acid adenylation domain-containing protein/thioester reductase-like protein